jgi:hypothetical protein
LMSGVTPAQVRVLFSSSHFQPTRTGHGGNRRAQQLYDLLAAAGLDIATPTPVRDNVLAGLLHADGRSVRAFAQSTHLGPLKRVRVAAGFARNYGDWRRGLAMHKDARVLVCEDAENAPLLRAAKDAGKRVVLAPQNIESLRPGARDARTGHVFPRSLEYELDHLALADRVFAISREEQWLLRLREIDAAYLPFFPDPLQRERWLDFRRRRSAPCDRFVVLGSAVNPPTRAGMHELLSWIRSEPASSGEPIHVIGYGTESLRDLAGGRIVIHGGVDDTVLEDHLLRARAVILHQRAAVGALIRVSEMLLAGVPVLASAMAARSTSQYAGVIAYESLAELASLLRRGSWEQPPIPTPPAKFEEDFVNTIAEWAETR